MTAAQLQCAVYCLATCGITCVRMRGQVRVKRLALLRQRYVDGACGVGAAAPGGAMEAGACALPEPQLAELEAVEPIRAVHSDLPLFDALREFRAARSHMLARRPAWLHPMRLTPHLHWLHPLQPCRPFPAQSCPGRTAGPGATVNCGDESAARCVARALRAGWLTARLLAWAGWRRR